MAFYWSIAYFIYLLFLSIHLSLKALKYVLTGIPVFSYSGIPLTSSTSAKVLLSHHTIALCKGYPFFLDHTTVVSLWFVIPIETIYYFEYFVRAYWISFLVFLRISIGLCSTQPGFVVICRWGREELWISCP